MPADNVRILGLFKDDSCTWAANLQRSWTYKGGSLGERGTPPPKTTIASKKLSVRLLGISSGSLNMDGMSISITNTDI